MKAYQFAATERVRRANIRSFGGVDYRTHETKLSLSRSPDLQNLLCSQNDFLEKRTGWKTQARFSGTVYGLFPLPDESGFAVHAGKELYTLIDGVQTRLAQDMNEAFSGSFVMRGVLYLLDGKTFRAVRHPIGEATSAAWESVPVREIAFVPTTTISAAPTGGGESDEPVNLLTPKRINTFVGTGSATQFQLDADHIDADEVTAAVNDTAVTVSSVDRETGLVTLARAPANGNGLANVSISFSKTIDGNADCIDSCRFAGLYGGKNDTRVFLAGNAAAPHTDYMSGLYDPTYFPDTGYTQIGTDESAIVGYLKHYDSQIVLKAGGAQQAVSYLRTYMMAEDGTALYPLKQGVQGTGALAPRTAATLDDVPYYLSSDGVMGVYGTAVAEQRNAQCVSEAINPKLTAEPALADACALVQGRRYYLAINGHLYLADGRLTEPDGQPAWFFWSNVPAVSLAALDGRLWFGTATGSVCRFAAAEEQEAYSDDGQAIDAYWRTPTLPLSNWGNVKTIRDVQPTLMPYSRSGATVVYEGENGTVTALRQNMDLFSFRTVDFGRFSFRCVPGAVSYRTRRRQHKTPLFAVRIGNDRLNEPFGLLGITIRYTVGRTIL